MPETAKLYPPPVFIRPKPTEDGEAVPAYDFEERASISVHLVFLVGFIRHYYLATKYIGKDASEAMCKKFAEDVNRTVRKLTDLDVIIIGSYDNGIGWTVDFHKLADFADKFLQFGEN